MTDYHRSQYSFYRYHFVLNRCLCLLFVFYLSGCQSAESISDNPAVQGELSLVPLEEYRDFISLDSDPVTSGNASAPVGGFSQVLVADAVAASGNDIFVADTSQRIVFRIDRGRRAISRFANLQSGIETDLFLSDDLSLYVLDGSQQQVNQYTFDGRLVNVFRDGIEMGTPVAVAWSRSYNGLLVADRVKNQLLVFNRLGGLSRTMGQNINTSPIAGAIKDIAAVNEIIFVLDETAKQVNAIDANGRLLYSFGNDVLKQPSAISVDHCQRVFVADQFDNAIHVFMKDKHLATFNNNSAYSNIVRINDIDIDIDVIYIADGATGVIKVMKITGKCP